MKQLKAHTFRYASTIGQQFPDEEDVVQTIFCLLCFGT